MNLLVVNLIRRRNKFITKLWK